MTGLAGAGAVPLGKAAVAVPADEAEAAEAADRAGDPARTVALDEAARHLALWMCYEDVIRVADLKTRKGRRERVRAEAQAQSTDVVRVVEYLKPGVEEIAAILPRRAGSWLMRSSAEHGWLKRAQVGVACALERPLGTPALACDGPPAAVQAVVAPVPRGAGGDRGLDAGDGTSPAHLAELRPPTRPNCLRCSRVTATRNCAGGIITRDCGRRTSRLRSAKAVTSTPRPGGSKEALAQTLADPEGRLNAAASTAGDASVESRAVPHLTLLPSPRPSAGSSGPGEAHCAIELPDANHEDDTMNAPADPMLRAATLEDRYEATEGAVYLTGTQALVRLPMMQRQRDVAAGAQHRRLHLRLSRLADRRLRPGAGQGEAASGRSTTSASCRASTRISPPRPSGARSR